MPQEHRVGLNILLFIIVLVCEQKFGFTSEAGNPADYDEILGRWNVTVYNPNHVYPNWFEVKLVKGELQGRFSGSGGATRTIDYLYYGDRTLYLSFPPMYERRADDLLFIGDYHNDEIEGKTTNASGEIVRFLAVRAPALEFEGEPDWGEPVDYLTGKDLSVWLPKRSGQPFGWLLSDNVLKNVPPSVDLVTREKFMDFKLHIEFRMPPDMPSNSGIFLRGRYEIQISDYHAQELNPRSCGGIYGFITPLRWMLKPRGEWNTYDVTLVGRNVTVIFDGEKVIDNQEIPGITTGALNSREAEPGPLLLQGDHGHIEFRNILISRPEGEQSIFY
jgi:hypothetical protein